MQQGPSLTGHEGVAAWVASNSSLVAAYHPMTDASSGGTMADESGNGRTGTYKTGTLSVDGTTELAKNASATGLATVAYGSWMDSITGGFAVVYCNADAGNNFRMIVGRDEGPTFERSMQFRLEDTGTGFRLQAVRAATTSGTVSSASDSVSDDTVTTVAWYRDASGDVRIFINGVYQAEATLGDMSVNSPPMTYGTDDLVGTDYSFGATDQMGSVVHLVGTITDANIEALHTAWAG